MTAGRASLRKRQGRGGVDVGDHVQDDGALLVREGPVEGALDLPWLLDPDAGRPQALGYLGQVHLVEAPELAGLLGLLAAVGAVEAALGLVPGAVVVHQDR